MLSLLSVEIDMFVTWLCPLDLDTRDLVAAQLGREAARQLDDVIKRREDVRLKTGDKKWREYARDSWDISPTLAVFLPSWINVSPALALEVSRLVRCNPTKAEWSTLIGPDPSRYCALIGWTLLCWCQGLCHNNTSQNK